MTVIEAILLGIIQGLTEFLPVSSSGHLVIVQTYLPNFTPPGVTFDVWLHLGTLVAVIIYFRQDIKDILFSLYPQKDEVSALKAEQRKLAGLIILGCIPTAVIGLTFKDQFEALFGLALPVSIMLGITGLLLWLADRVTSAPRKLKQMGILDAIIIGAVQGMAIIPGISRSGSTIAVGIYRRLDRTLAARYSFLISIPAVMGAALLEAKEWGSLMGSLNLLPLAMGFICAAVSGYLAIGMLMRLVIKHKLSYFAYYCWTVALLNLMAYYIIPMQG